MELNNLFSTPGSHRRGKRLGRGDASGKGGSAGKGTKGQMSRKGHKHKAGFEGGQIVLIRRLPKRGFKNPARTAYTPVNLDQLNVFAEGAEVTAAALMALNVVKSFENGGFKLLGRGELEVKGLKIKANAVSETAKSKIEAAGGSVEIVK